MNLDLSFSLLSTDNSKISADDIKGQDSSTSDVSFADLLSGELEEAEPASSGQHRQELAAAQGLATTAATRTSCKAEPLYSAKTAGQAGIDDAANALTGQNLSDPAALITTVVATPDQTTADMLERGARPANQAEVVVDPAAAETSLPTAEEVALLPASWLQMISQARDYQATVSAASSTNTAPADGMPSGKTPADGQNQAAADVLNDGLTAAEQAMLELAATGSTGAETGAVAAIEAGVVSTESTTKLAQPTSGAGTVGAGSVAPPALPANTIEATETTAATDAAAVGKSQVSTKLNAADNNTTDTNTADNKAADSKIAADSLEKSAAKNSVAPQVSQLSASQQPGAKGAGEANVVKSATEAAVLVAESGLAAQQKAAQLLSQQSTPQFTQQSLQQASGQRLDVMTEAGGKTATGAVQVAVAAAVQSQQAAAQLQTGQPQSDSADLKSQLQQTLAATVSESGPQVPVPAAVPGANASSRLSSTSAELSLSATLLATEETAPTEQAHALLADSLAEPLAEPSAVKNQATAPVTVPTAAKNLQSASPIQLTQTAETLPETDPSKAQPAIPAVAAKTTQQSFVQYRKAVNAQQQAQQKQQLKAELAQSGQTTETLAQNAQPKSAEFNWPGLQPVSNPERPLLEQTSRPTERSATQGLAQPGAMATASTASSPLTPSRSSEATQPQQQPLALLEPNAAAMLKDRVMYQVNQKMQSAEIRLSPEDLGSVQVKVQLQQEQLSVQFVVQQQGAKEALEQQMPKLRELLAEQGLELSEGHVSQQQHSGADERASGRAAGTQASPADAGVDDGQEVNLPQKPRKMSDRMVDYYA